MTAHREVIKVCKCNFLIQGKCVIYKGVVHGTRMSISYVSGDVLLFAQNLIVHIQISTQVGNVLLKNVFVRSQASIPVWGKHRRHMSDSTGAQRCGI